MTKKALITGSETFGRYPANPSKWLALAAENQIIAGHKIYSLVFPSIIRLPADAEDHGTTIVKKALQIRARVILSFGLASDVKGFRVERSATNWIHNEKYCPPYENGRLIDEERPAKEKVQIDLSAWNISKVAKQFEQAGIPFEPEISDDPGNYSCNGWIYRTVLVLRKHNVQIPYLFIHTACTEEAIVFIPDFPRDKKVVIKNEDLLKALEIFLQSYHV